MQASPEIAALQRLWTHANGHSGQCRMIARFLLGLYDGERFPFDLTAFRGLDTAVFADCLAVLQLDHQPVREVHEWLGVPARQFEALAQAWRIDEARDAG